MTTSPYRGRLAPTPTGYLHLGHARTFDIAAQRAQSGELVFRNEDLDQARCRPEYVAAALADLHWFGLRWHAGPDVGGPHAPYQQSQRLAWYHTVWQQLHATGAIYPSPHTRTDVAAALSAPHAEDAEPVFPVELRPPVGTGAAEHTPGPVNWRFRVPDGECISFHDGHFGLTKRVAGEDFGDFLIWRKDGFPAYEFAVVADDHAMQITEVVRGADLLTSTARQLLLYQALGWVAPAFYHCPLLCDPQGKRLAKRTQGLSLRELRARGVSPEELRTALRKEQFARYFETP